MTLSYQWAEPSRLLEPSSAAAGPQQQQHPSCLRNEQQQRLDCGKTSAGISAVEAPERAFHSMALRDLLFGYASAQPDLEFGQRPLN